MSQAASLNQLRLSGLPGYSALLKIPAPLSNKFQCSSLIFWAFL